ncbi:hypothetical protein TI39_contig482g00004 [Zymoseptoria brevis]|uniref:Uncharacterized protein n=1 Tax=Zymoseptoria brevis TaxID=1047168 RepID=A0A0F4GJH1_9PEZI|nr:hypothetical protein TI39_contig482g00004 [Zymoseptoria brevis]
MSSTIVTIPGARFGSIIFVHGGWGIVALWQIEYGATQWTYHHVHDEDWQLFSDRVEALLPRDSEVLFCPMADGGELIVWLLYRQGLIFPGVIFNW